MNLHAYFIAFGVVQLFHSQEEIWTGFHKKWFMFTMPRYVFLTFEAALSAVIFIYIFYPHVAGATLFSHWFILLMLLNGIEHIVWALVERSYVPGLITAPIFLVLFVPYYLSLIKT